MEYVSQHPLVQFALETSYNFKLLGWSEPAATNAPIEDEVIQAVLGMNQKTHAPLPKKVLVFSAFCLPQSFFLLPTSLLFTSPLLPPSYLLNLILRSFHHQSSRQLEVGK